MYELAKFLWLSPFINKRRDAMSMHPKELETTMQLPATKRYAYFIKRALIL